ncbi:MAG: FAD-dependent oxidoreductase [Xanthomonadaceae bacterium]|nr:FAD-dependent oxidoreductase [Xanthomonadaceae bacterium]
MTCDAENAQITLDTFRAGNNNPVFLIGPNGTRVSFQSQQRRAFNLVYCLNKCEGLSGKKVAVVGGGVTGITAAVALSMNGASVHLYEEKIEIFQKIPHCTDRYIHPNINFIPIEKLSFTTDLPAMNWHADSARGVMRQLNNELRKHLHSHRNQGGRITTYPNRVSRLMNNQNGGVALYFMDGKKETRTPAYDYVICCTGFSSERKLKSKDGTEEYPGGTGYWDPDDVIQQHDARDQKIEQVVVVGGGDGGVIDALRYGPRIHGEDIHQFALHATLHTSNNPLDANLDHIIDKNKIKQGLKTVLLIKDQSSATRWHQHLLKWFSNYYSKDSTAASIEVEISSAVYFDSTNKKIIAELKHSQNQPRDLNIECSHVVIRTGGKHRVSLIESYLGGEGWKEFNYKEKHVSEFQLLKRWPDDYNDAGADENKADHLFNHAVDALSKWVEVYRKVSGQPGAQMELALSRATQGEQLESVDIHQKPLRKEATGNEIIYTVFCRPPIVHERLPGLPHIFGVPLTIEPKQKIVTKINGNI